MFSEKTVKMDGFMKKISSSIIRLFPVVRADDSEDDIQTILRFRCQKKECAQWYEKLETCNQRVRSKKKTSESCHEEMVDFVTCLDHCVAHDLFSKLK